MSLSSKKVVFSDIDGTLSEGFIILDFINFLKKDGFISNEFYSNQLSLTKDYKNGVISYFDWLEKWGISLANELSGKKQSVLISKAKKFFPEFLGKIPSSSKDLINYFHEKGYLVVGITAGLFECSSLIKDYLGIDILFASVIKANNDVYCNQMETDLNKPNGKEKLIKKFCEKNGVSLDDCVGLGDSMQDYEILKLTGKKIAVNPDSGLKKIALENNILISNYSNILMDIKKLV